MFPEEIGIILKQLVWPIKHMSITDNFLPQFYSYSFFFHLDKGLVLIAVKLIISIIYTTFVDVFT